MNRFPPLRLLIAVCIGVVVGICAASASASAPSQAAPKNTKADPTPIDARIVNAPLPVEVKSVGAPLQITGEITTTKDAKEAAADAESEKAKARADEELVNYTKILAWATTFLFAATGLLWWATYKLGRDAKAEGKIRAEEMRESLDTAAKSADAAHKQGARLGAQVDNAIKQTGIAREEFLATHRPAIKVRHFSIADGKPLRQFTEFAWQFCMFNVGDSAAKNIIIHYSSAWARSHMEAALDFEATQLDHHTSMVIEPGQLIKQSLPHKRALKAKPGQGHYVDDPSLKFFVVGRIKYEDALGVTRITGFLYEAFNINDGNQAVAGAGFCIFNPTQSDYQYMD